MTLDSRLATVVDAARSKKAFRIRIVDVKDIASFTDTFAFISPAERIDLYQAPFMRPATVDR